MKRWLMVMMMVLVVALCGCSGDDDGNGKDQPAGGGQSAAANGMVRPLSPRDLPLPPGEPYDFDAPFSAGQFVRQTAEGRATATHTGGLQATYLAGNTDMVLSVYHFDTAAEAIETVRFTLESASITQIVDTPFYSPTASFGVAQDRHGGHLAAWSQDKWCFLARTTGGLDALNSFLEVFPY